MTVIITLTLAGADTGPFDLYSDVDGYTSAFLTNVSRATLEASLITSAVPDNTTNILVKSIGICQRDLYLPVAGAPVTTTTTTSSTSSTTSTTTTPAPPPTEYTLAQIGRNAGADGCPLASILRIYLDASDYALFVANGYSFAGIGGGGPTTCTAIARNAVGLPITGRLFDEENITWTLSTGSFDYYTFQC